MIGGIDMHIWWAMEFIALHNSCLPTTPIVRSLGLLLFITLCFVFFAVANSPGGTAYARDPVLPDWVCNSYHPSVLWFLEIRTSPILLSWNALIKNALVWVQWILQWYFKEWIWEILHSWNHWSPQGHRSSLLIMYRDIFKIPTVYLRIL